VVRGEADDARRSETSAYSDDEPLPTGHGTILVGRTPVAYQRSRPVTKGSGKEATNFARGLQPSFAWLRRLTRRRPASIISTRQGGPELGRNACDEQVADRSGVTPGTLRRSGIRRATNRALPRTMRRARRDWSGRPPHPS
jgi:hypothetical protein